MGYPRYQGRLLTRYSPVRHSTRLPKKTFAFDLHVLSTPPAFVLSQDQTLQFDILDYPLRDSYLHMCCIYKSSLCITKFALRANLERSPLWARLRLCCYSVFKDRAQALQTTEGPAVRMPRRASYSNTTESAGQCFSLLFLPFVLLDPPVTTTTSSWPPRVSCSSKSAANYLIDATPSRGFLVIEGIIVDD